MYERQAAFLLTAMASALLAACASSPAAAPPASMPGYGADGDAPPVPAYAGSPAYRRPTRAEEEQRITAERLADWQTTGAGAASPTGTGMITDGVQPALVPAIRTSYYPGPAPEGAPTAAQTEYYRGDFSEGGEIPPMPAAAHAGECYALVRTPALVRRVDHDFVERPGYDELQVRPAQFEPQRQDFVEQEAYERLEIIPATYRTVTEQVQVVPPTVRYVTGEPHYETVTEQVVERPARQVWKKGRGAVEKRDDATGEILCLVDEPAVYRTVTRQVLKRDTQLREVQIPGEYRTVTHNVIDQPPLVRRVSIPAERASVRVQKMVAPPAYERVRIPDQIATLSTQEVAAPSSLEWRPVLCETSMKPETVRRVQDALRRAGFDPGVSDGKPGRRTLDALNRYQRKNRLPEDRYLNLQTLQALGVSYG